MQPSTFISTGGRIHLSRHQRHTGLQQNKATPCSKKVGSGSTFAALDSDLWAGKMNEATCADLSQLGCKVHTYNTHPATPYLPRPTAVCVKTQQGFGFYRTQCECSLGVSI